MGQQTVPEGFIPDALPGGFVPDGRTEPAARPTPPASRSIVDTLVDLLPTAGGAIGGGIGTFVGGPALGVPLAAVGGAVGEGYHQLATHAAEIPGAIADVARNLIAQPVATIRGAVQGAREGETQTGKEAASQGGAEAVGGAVAKAAGGTARAVYRGYLKPSLSERMLPKAQQIVQTALDEALPISRQGAATANRVIDELRGEVERILADMPGTIDLKQIADRVRGFARRRYFRAGKPVEDYQAALKVADAIDQHPSLMQPGSSVTRETESRLVDASGKPFTATEQVPGPPVANTKATLSQANQVKRSLDESVGENNFGVERGATKTTQKVGRYTTRRLIENASGGSTGQVAQLNARESKLIDAAKTIARAVEREANQNKVYGVKTLVAGGVGGVQFYKEHDPASAAATALATRLALQPAVASRAAIVAYRLSKELGIGAASAARLAVYAVSGSEDSEQKPDEQIQNE